jgi:hypothetical protein
MLLSVRFFITCTISVGVTSENANVVVGIEIAGRSKEVSIYQNYVNLNDDVGNDLTDKYIALRTRSKVDPDTVVVEKKNVLIQGMKLEEQDPGILVRRFRSLLDASLSGHNNEWVFGETPGYGGCPYARN